MTNISTQKDRILQYLDSKGINKRKFYTETGIANGVLDKKSGLTSDTIEKFYSKFNDVNLEWLFTGKGEMLREDFLKLEREAMYKALNPEKYIAPAEGIPLMPNNVFPKIEAGHIRGDYERYIIPAFTDADFLTTVRGMAMIPTYRNGDLVACKILPRDTFTQWGKAYAVDTEQGLLVRYIKPSEKDGYIRLVSENDYYVEVELKQTHIKNIALILGTIRIE